MNVTEKNGHIVAHLINYHVQKETQQVEEILPVYDLVLKISSSLAVPGEALLIPGEHRLKTEESDGYITVKSLALTCIRRWYSRKRYPNECAGPRIVQGL